MKKLLLTSAAFTNQAIKDGFARLVAKPFEALRIVFIPTASRTEEELDYVAVSKKELLELGIKTENIKELQLEHKISPEELKNADVIYVCGGNTFYLLKKVRESHFDQVFLQFMERGGVYVGVSAGSILVGPNIAVAGIGENGDKNDVHLTDTRGLNKVPFAISPHYTEKEKNILDTMEAKVDYKIKRITDHEAILITDETVQMLGTGNL